MSLSANGINKYRRYTSDLQSPGNLINSTGIPHWKAVRPLPQDVKVTSLHDKLEKATGVRENGLSVFPGL